MKRFLGFISLIYSILLTYILFSNQIKNYLAPQMHIFIKLSIIPLFLIGLTLIFSKHIHYKFKFSDLILLLPLIVLFFSNNSTLSASLAITKSLKRSKNTPKVVEKVETTTVSTTEPTTEATKKVTVTINNIYFDVDDSMFMDLANQLTFDERNLKYEGKTIKVKGFAVTKNDILPSGMFGIGRYAVSCCIADASFAGFIVNYDLSNIKENSWYEVTGVLKAGKDNEGLDILYIEAIEVKEIPSNQEEKYVYPCYSYDDKCTKLQQYDIG